MSSSQQPHASATERDDMRDVIDWDEIIATTEDDYLAGRFAFNSADYPCHEVAMVEMKKWLDGLFEEAMREGGAVHPLHATRK